MKLSLTTQFSLFMHAVRTTAPKVSYICVPLWITMVCHAKESLDGLGLFAVLWTCMTRLYGVVDVMSLKADKDSNLYFSRVPCFLIVWMWDNDTEEWFKEASQCLYYQRPHAKRSQFTSLLPLPLPSAVLCMLKTPRAKWVEQRTADGVGATLTRRGWDMTSSSSPSNIL